MAIWALVDIGATTISNQNCWHKNFRPENYRFETKLKIFLFRNTLKTDISSDNVYRLRSVYLKKSLNETYKRRTPFIAKFFLPKKESNVDLQMIQISSFTFFCSLLSTK